MSDEQRMRDAAQAVIDEFDADVYFYSAEIDDAGYGKLIGAVTENKSKNNALLILVTNGGSANSAYQIARFLQKTYFDGEFILFIPSYCKSAGTLIALGANRLLMDTFSELGPLDVQVPRQDEIGTRKSGLLSRSSFEALQEVSFDLFEHLMLQIKRRSGDLVSFKLAAEVSSNLTSSLMSGVYGQISPDVVGDDFRDLQVALHYGVRLVGYSKNATIRSVKHLVEHYPSHDFVIDDEEASALFFDVDVPSESLYGLLDFLGDAAYDEHSSGVVVPLRGHAGSSGENADADNDASEGEAPQQEGEPPRLDGNGKEDRPSDPKATGE